MRGKIISLYFSNCNQSLKLFIYTNVAVCILKKKNFKWPSIIQLCNVCSFVITTRIIEVVGCKKLRDQNNYLLTGKKCHFFTEINSRCNNMRELIEVKSDTFYRLIRTFLPKTKIFARISKVATLTLLDQ